MAYWVSDKHLALHLNQEKWLFTAVAFSGGTSSSWARWMALPFVSSCLQTVNLCLAHWPILQATCPMQVAASMGSSQHLSATHQKVVLFLAAVVVISKILAVYSLMTPHCSAT